MRYPLSKIKMRDNNILGSSIHSFRPVSVQFPASFRQAELKNLNRSKQDCLECSLSGPYLMILVKKERSLQMPRVLLEISSSVSAHMEGGKANWP